MNPILTWRCPICASQLHHSRGGLECTSCKHIVVSSEGVLQFLEGVDIATSFGFQWNKFPLVQLDSYSKDSRSRERFISETGWVEPLSESGLILDAGCGSGRFSEIALRLGPHLVMVDASDAIYAAKENLGMSSKATFVKASLLALPFNDYSFDYVYCIGVIQHTSQPVKAIQELCRVTKKGGQLALTFYEKRGWWTHLYSKYLVRPLTKRIPEKYLLELITRSSILWFPLTCFLFKLPKPFSSLFRFIIPVANYVDFDYSNRDLQRAEAILDTFDMLSPVYDSPIKKQVVIQLLEDSGYQILDSSIKGNVKAQRVN